MTIVVPAFNEAAGIERSVRSLASSGYPDFEVIVVDDGSTDDTPSVLESARGAFPPSFTFHRKDNGGPGLREHYHPTYYGAFVFDPDGNNIEAVCHAPPDG